MGDDDDVVNRLRKLSGDLDNAKKASKKTSKEIAKAQTEAKRANSLLTEFRAKHEPRHRRTKKR